MTEYLERQLDLYFQKQLGDPEMRGLIDEELALQLFVSNASALRQMAETLQELHEPPRVLVAVAEEIAPELGLGLRRQLGLLEWGRYTPP